MNLQNLLNNDPELKRAVNDFSSGKDTRDTTNRYDGVPFSSHKGMREAYDMADDLAKQMRGEKGKW